MSLNGLVGTLNIKLNDGENDVTIASLRNCTISHNLQLLERLNEDAYGWRDFVPGNRDWGATANHLELLTDGETAAYLQSLQDLAFNKTLLTFEFTHDNAIHYYGTGYIETWQVGGAEGDAFAGNFSIKGLGDLEHLFWTIPRIYMYLQGGSVADVGGAGLYRQSIDLDDLELMQLDADPMEQMAVIHKARKLIYSKSSSSTTIYQYDLHTGVESVFTILAARTGSDPFRFQLDTVNDWVLVTVDQGGLFKSLIYTLDYDGNTVSVWTPTALGDSGVNFDILGINHAANEVYLEVSAFWDYQAFHYDTKAYKHAIWANAGAQTGWFGNYAPAADEFYCGDNTNGLARISNGVNQSGTEVGIGLMNYTNIRQIYYSTYDDLIYTGNDDTGDTSRIDRLGNNKEDLIGFAGVSARSLCVYDPNLRR